MKIETSARLHLSLIDLNGFEGRIDGGIGITLQNPKLTIECEETESETKILFNNKEEFNNITEYTSKILGASNKIQEYLGINKEYIFNIKKHYPIHQGLGLGTQLSLSIGQLIAKSNDITLSSHTLGTIVNRGGTSGIGVESFNNGGLIIDGGHKKDDKKKFLPSSASHVAPPPIIGRYNFPEDWKIIIAKPDINHSVSGTEEVDVFQTYTPIDLNEVKDICYLTLMKVIPSLLDNDLENFGDAINKIQMLGFKRIERDLQEAIINKSINFMKDNGVACAGMSSFGPTCFGITDTDTKKITKELKLMLGKTSEITVTNAKNYGAIIEE